MGKPFTGRRLDQNKMKCTLDITVPVVPDAILLAVQEIASAGDVL